jgi:tyrosine-protein kinase Etk/Wzc
MQQTSTGNTPVPPAPGNETARFFALLLRHKWFILATVLIATGVSVWAVLRMPNWYAATVNLVPPKSSAASGLAGNISSALKDFGLSKLGGSSGGEVYSYMVILQSRRLQDSLIEAFHLSEEYEIPTSEMSLLRAALSENFEVTYEKEGNYTITIWDKDPVKAAQMANTTVNIANSIANEVVRTEATDNRLYAEKRLRENQLSFERAADSLKTFTRLYKIYAPPEQAAAAATAIVDLKAQVMQQEMRVQAYKNLLGADDPATIQQQRLYEDLSQQVSRVETQPGFLGNFPIDKGSEIAVEYTRLVTDVEVFAKMKAFLLPTLEQYKLDEHRSLPNLYVLDPAVPPEKKGRPKRSLIVGGTALGTFVLVVMFILLWDRFRILKQTYPQVFASNKALRKAEKERLETV